MRTIIEGFGLGAAIGLFSSSVNPNVASVEKQQTAKEIFREMKTTTVGYAKNFAVVGCVFSAVECTIESVRKNFPFFFTHFCTFKFCDSSFFYFQKVEKTLTRQLNLLRRTYSSTFNDRYFVTVQGEVRLEEWNLCRRRDGGINRSQRWLESRLELLVQSRHQISFPNRC